MFQRRSGDESIGGTGFCLPPKPARTLGNRAIDRDLSEGCQEAADAVFLGLGPSEELTAGHDRIGESPTGGVQPASTAQMVNEHIGVDKKLSHDPTRRVTEQ
jgi:hypothetical protein